jgi:hypothetical protein
LTDKANDKDDAQPISHVLAPISRLEEQDAWATVAAELQPRPPTAHDAHENHDADER